MLQFAQKYMNTNIIMVNIPLRYDLAMNSQINLEIQDFNNKLSKRAKLFSHVDLVETNFNRKYFTKHGLHLNNVGKELANVIAAIKLNTQKRKVIIMCIYRAPSGNFECFLSKLEIILNCLHKHNIKFIICGDININYL